MKDDYILKAAYQNQSTDRLGELSLNTLCFVFQAEEFASTLPPVKKKKKKTQNPKNPPPENLYSLEWVSICNWLESCKQFVWWFTGRNRFQFLLFELRWFCREMGAKQYISHIIMRPGLEFTVEVSYKYGLVETVANWDHHWALPNKNPQNNFFEFCNFIWFIWYILLIPTVVSETFFLKYSQNKIIAALPYKEK